MVERGQRTSDNGMTKTTKYSGLFYLIHQKNSFFMLKISKIKLY